MKKRFNINLDDSAFTRERTPPKQHFQPSSKAANNQLSTAASGAAAAHQPLSYAEYIVQSKKHAASAAASAAAPPHTHSSSKPLSCDGAGASSLQRSEAHPAPSAAETSGERQRFEEDGEGGPHTQVVDTDQRDVSGQRSDPGLNTGPKPAGSGSSIIVSPRQRGNPILKFVRSVPWEFGEVVPDYVLGQTTCALFLSLRYHNLNPNYIHDRLKQLGQTFTLRVLLVQVDVKDPHHTLKELARICIMADCTLILAWRQA